MTKIVEFKTVVVECQAKPEVLDLIAAIGAVVCGGLATAFIVVAVFKLVREWKIYKKGDQS